MTAIACFRIRGRPTILGDALVTHDGRPTDLDRKLLLVSPRLAVAWTGDRLAAQVTFERLLGLRNVGDVSLNGLTQLLTAEELRHDLASLNVVVIGWLITDKEEICFRWNSAWYQEVFLSDGEAFVDGTGENQILSSLHGALGMADRLDSSDLDDGAILVRITADLLRPELHIQSSAHLGHGVIYEGAQLSDRRVFRHLPNTLYFALEHKMTADGKHLSSHVLDPVARVAHLQNALIYDYSVNDGRETTRTIILPIAGTNTTRAKWESRAQRSLPGTRISEYYCEWHYFQCPGFVNPNIPMIYRHDRSARLLQFTGRTSFARRIESREIENFFLFIRNSENETVRTCEEFPMPVLPQRMPL